MRGRGLVRLTDLIAGAALLCAVLPAATAGAASNSLTLSFSPGDPSGITPVTVTANGSTAAAGEYLIVAVVPASTGCPSQYENVSGGYWINEQLQAAGTFTAVHSAARQLEHGSYDICGWLADSSSGPPVLNASAPMAISNPDTLSLSDSPSAVTDGASATVSVNGVADVDNPEVYVTEKPAADGGCAANPGADTGIPLSGYDPASVTFGTFSDSATEAPGSGSSGPDALPPGRYELCGWLMDGDGSSTVPLAPVASATITLKAPIGSLAYSVPELVHAGTKFAITAALSTTSSDVGLYLDYKPLPASGSPCASSQSLEPKDAQLVISDGHQASTDVSARVRRAGVYVACAWLEWPHGTVDGPFAGRFVVLSKHQRPLVFSGSTSQRPRLPHAISLETVDQQVVDLTYRARFSCTRPGRRTTNPIYATTFPAFGSVRGGAFLESFVQGTDIASIGGRLGARSAHGTFREAYSSRGYECRSGLVSFTARRG
ncbi:MAG TPA: hypothetical protein VMD48_15760 [Solirubrobacteraceae bacterium]|nr:hypothetical protein [Solirubrobacteraceae bacterium]